MASNSAQTLHIKNMVCQRCVRVVREELERLGYTVHDVELGKAEVSGNINSEDTQKALQQAGFELLTDQKVQLIEQLKTLIIELVHYSDEPLRVNYSDYLSQKTNREYGYLSQLFSSHEGTTLERYIILQKIEKVKELLVYGQLTLSEIAHLQHYSSVAHLSSQFKQVTGLTPTQFKQLQQKNRKPLDQV